MARLFHANLDRLDKRISKNDMLERSKGLVDELEVDMVTYNWHKTRKGHKLNINGMSQLLDE